MPDFRPHEEVMYQRAVDAARKLETVNVVTLQTAMAAESDGAKGTVSYNGAVEFLTRMEDDGIVGPMNDAGVRQVLPAATPPPAPASAPPPTPEPTPAPESLP